MPLAVRTKSNHVRRGSLTEGPRGAGHDKERHRARAFELRLKGMQCLM